MMKLSEFVLTHTKGGLLNREYFAEVSVTTGFLWWKRTERRKIYREYIGFWRFLDSGEFTPLLQAECLESAYRTRESLRLLEQDKQ